MVAGCVTPAGDQASDVGRLATLKAGFPIDVPGVQINRFCGSGQQAIHFAIGRLVQYWVLDRLKKF